MTKFFGYTPEHPVGAPRVISTTFHHIYVFILASQGHNKTIQPWNNKLQITLPNTVVQCPQQFSAVTSQRTHARAITRIKKYSNACVVSEFLGTVTETQHAPTFSQETFQRREIRPYCLSVMYTSELTETRAVKGINRLAWQRTTLRLQDQSNGFSEKVQRSLDNRHHTCTA